MVSKFLVFRLLMTGVMHSRASIFYMVNSLVPLFCIASFFLVALLFMRVVVNSPVSLFGMVSGERLLTGLFGLLYLLVITTPVLPRCMHAHLGHNVVHELASAVLL